MTHNVIVLASSVFNFPTIPVRDRVSVWVSVWVVFGLVFGLEGRESG